MPSLSFKLGGFRTTPFQSLDLPVEIRKPNLALVGRTLTSQKLEVVPGTYFVAATLPAGQKLLTRVEVTTSDVTAELRPDPDDESPHESHEQHHFFGEPFRTSRSESSEFSARRSDGSSTEVEFRAPAKKTRIAKVSLLHGRDPIEAVASPQNLWFQSLEGAVQYNYQAFQSFPATSHHYLEVIQPAGKATRVALPASDSAKCFAVLRASSAEQTSIDVHLENVEADLLLRGSQTGRQVAIAEESLSMSPKTLLYEDSEELVRQKMADPIAAAVGAYILLGWGELKRLRDWTENLKNWFVWLPDGLAIRGEHLAELGRHDEALRNFVGLADRGTPMFRDGLSYATERLRLYTETKTKTFAPEIIEKAKEVRDWLESVAAHVDFSQPILTVCGLSPSSEADSPSTAELPIDFTTTRTFEAQEQAEEGAVG